MNTNKYNNNRPSALLLLSLCLVVLGINGFVGGYLMLADPNGAPMGMPVSHLERTPFENFTIPGVLLILVWGCGSFITLFGLWRRAQTPLFTPLTEWTHEHWAWGFSVLLGAGLFIWLTVQVFTLPEMAPPQYILYCFAVLMIGLPLLPAMRGYYQLQDRR